MKKKRSLVTPRYSGTCRIYTGESETHQNYYMNSYTLSIAAQERVARHTGTIRTPSPIQDTYKFRWRTDSIPFTPFLAKSLPFNRSVQRGQICERTNFFHFSARSEKIWRRWPAIATRFFSPPDRLFRHLSIYFFDRVTSIR